MTKKLTCLEGYWFVCKCGYKTPVSTGMMAHLSFYKGKNHRYVEAVIPPKRGNGN